MVFENPYNKIFSYFAINHNLYSLINRIIHNKLYNYRNYFESNKDFKVIRRPVLGEIIGARNNNINQICRARIIGTGSSICL